MADYYIEQEIMRGANFGYHHGKSYVGKSGKPPYHFNPYLKGNEYNNLIRFLTKSLSNDKRLTETEAKRYILDCLIKKGKFPYPRIGKLNSTELVSLYNIIKNAGLELDGYNESDIKIKVALEKEKEEAKVKTTVNTSVPNSEVERLFRVEVIDREEGEFSIVVERGMYREVVAVSYSYPHYRKLGFYAGRKSSVFSREDDTDKMVIDMPTILSSLANLLNNLASADLLDEERYNNAVDGFEPFIYEALEFSEFESLISKTSGLKDGKKKRIKARGTKGSALQK